MTKDFETPDHPNGMEAELAVRKAGREASSQADGLASPRRAHQREARYLLERAGMLERRRQRFVGRSDRQPRCLPATASGYPSV